MNHSSDVNYNPDVLSCLANLSNDEVFTPPNLVNDILDLLPEELWSNDFTEPWTDEKLYAKYGLTEEEIAFIESMIRPMENSLNDDSSNSGDEND
ncbi:MAG TPA: hypothetical protein PKA00_15580 [Saprospiraceae bacterium]|nr:hypothetical protein [Saprospiraceae bacterium]HMQ84334.1 hypothetical protein [Saprospiraceae bacterium]